MAQINYSRVKAVVNDDFNRWAEDAEIKGCIVKYISAEKTFDIQTTKKRESSSGTPEKVVTTKQNESVYMRFVEQAHGYAFKMKCNTGVLIDKGEDALVEEFRTVVHEYLEKMKALKAQDSTSSPTKEK